MERVSELIGAEAIANRVSELAREIVEGEGQEGAGELFLVVLLNGAFVFAADLLRALDALGAAPAVDFVAVSSYEMGMESTGTITFRCEPKGGVEGKDVLLVDDIVDTGRSLVAVTSWLEAQGATRVRTCTLLDKPSRRAVDVSADYTGFEIEDRFVVGYGLDCAERWRHLPYVGVLETSVGVLES